MKNRLSYLVLALLGFAGACDKEKGEESLVMYGTPRADLRVQGKVTDAAGKPIKGIKVSSNSYLETAVLTRLDGTYDLSEEQLETKLHLTFTDIDGPENGGEFVQKSQEITFTEADRTEKGKGLYEGSFEKKNVNIQLTEKE